MMCLILLLLDVMHSAADRANVAGTLSFCVWTVPFVMRSVLVHLLFTDKFVYPKYSRWFLFLFDFIGAGADNDLYINQAIVFIEDAIQVSKNVFVSCYVMLPMLGVCHVLCQFLSFSVFRQHL